MGTDMQLIGGDLKPAELTVCNLCEGGHSLASQPGSDVRVARSVLQLVRWSTDFWVVYTST